MKKWSNPRGTSDIRLMGMIGQGYSRSSEWEGAIEPLGYSRYPSEGMIEGGLASFKIRDFKILGIRPSLWASVYMYIFGGVG